MARCDANRGWAKALFGVVLCLALSLFAPKAWAEALDEPAATKLVRQFVEAAALGGPDFGGADGYFADKGFERGADGRMSRDGGGSLVTSPEAGRAGPLVMTFVIKDWYGLLVVFEEELAKRFGAAAARRLTRELPATYAVQINGREVTFAFLPGEKDGQKLIAMVAAGL